MTIIVCPTCGARNRVSPIASGFPRCPSCKSELPWVVVLEDLARRHAGRLKVVKVDVDSNPGLAADFGAQSIPLLVVIRDGREVDRIVGGLPRAALEQRLGPLLAG
jgi:thioredoxin 2